MYEEKKDGKTYSRAIRLFIGVPWTVRAFFYLFFIIVACLFAFGFAGAHFHVPVFDTVAAYLAEALKVVSGAVIGALVAEAKFGAERFKGADREDT